MTDFVHNFSERGSLECMSVNWRDLESKSKSELKLFHDGASCAAFTLMDINGVQGSSLLLVFVVLPLRCCLSACTLPAYPRWKITLFAAQGLLMSAQHCLVFVLDFQSWRVKNEGDKSKVRSTQVEVRGLTPPATWSIHQVGSGDNSVQLYNTLGDRSLGAKQNCEGRVTPSNQFS